jgi:hypothetical protein
MTLGHIFTAATLDTIVALVIPFVAVLVSSSVLVL